MSVPEPSKILTPWATSGLKNTIPSAADPVSGKAGYDQGFPAINMTPKEAGGIPPYGQDFNGILFSVTEVLRYIQAGAKPTFSAALASAIGGYPKGAMVISNDGNIIYRNTIDSNLSDPNSAGAGWVGEQATETVLGMMKVATQTQTNAGAADDVAVTPKKLRAGFAISLADNGYIAFPTWLSGLIIQWGKSTVNGSSTTTVTFPIAFTTACSQVVGGHDDATATVDTGYVYGFGPFSANSMGFGVRALNGSTNPVSIRWIAIGH